MKSSHNILVLQNHEEDTPAALTTWFGALGQDLKVIEGFRDTSLLPRSLDGVDGLIVLGGAMNCEEDDIAPWLPQTRNLLREAVERGTPTLGICLGGQMMAVAMGGRVTRAPQGEYGVVTLDPTPAMKDDVLMGNLIHPMLAGQWHGDHIEELPPGAVLLATSKRCGVQAFRMGARAWGFQFHPELTAAVGRGWQSSEPELAPAGDEIAKSEAALHQVWRPIAQRFIDIIDQHRAHPSAR